MLWRRSLLGSSALFSPLSTRGCGRLISRSILPFSCRWLPLGPVRSWGCGRSRASRPLEGSLHTPLAVLHRLPLPWRVPGGNSRFLVKRVLHYTVVGLVLSYSRAAALCERSADRARRDG